MRREVFTITTEWKRDELGHPMMRATTRFLVDREPTVCEWERLPPETHAMSDEQVATLIVEGKMFGVFLIERTLPMRYVDPEEFERRLDEYKKLLGEIGYE